MAHVNSGRLVRPVLEALLGDEQVEVYLETEESALAVTDRRVIVASENHTMLDVQMNELRRIELTIEKGRAPLLTIVPERPTDVPQFIAIEPGQFDKVCELISSLGSRVAAGD
jgi:hypothetical protein